MFGHIFTQSEIRAKDRIQQLSITVIHKHGTLQAVSNEHAARWAHSHIHRRPLGRPRVGW